MRVVHCVWRNNIGAVASAGAFPSILIQFPQPVLPFDEWSSAQFTRYAVVTLAEGACARPLPTRAEVFATLTAKQLAYFGVAFETPRDCVKWMLENGTKSMQLRLAAGFTASGSLVASAFP